MACARCSVRSSASWSRTKLRPRELSERATYPVNLQNRTRVAVTCRVRCAAHKVVVPCSAACAPASLLISAHHCLHACPQSPHAYVVVCLFCAAHHDRHAPRALARSSTRTSRIPMPVSLHHRPSPTPASQGRNPALRGRASMA